MTAKFKVGDICIWQNCVGFWSYLNGTETTITSDLRAGYDPMTCTFGEGYGTSTPSPTGASPLLGEPHELRLRKPPTTGEQVIRAMFAAPPQPVLEVA